MANVASLDAEYAAAIDHLFDSAGQRDANIIYLGTNLGVYRSVDRGASWAPMWAGNSPARGEETSCHDEEERRRSCQTPIHRTAASERNDVARSEALNRAGYNVGVPDGMVGTKTMAGTQEDFRPSKLCRSQESSMTITLRRLGLNRGSRGRAKHAASDSY